MFSSQYSGGGIPEVARRDIFSVVDDVQYPVGISSVPGSMFNTVEGYQKLC